MKVLYTIGFTKKTAQCFFETLEKANVDIVIDTRINADSQLSGFAKKEDLRFFLKHFYNISYAYRPDLAPTKDLLNRYRKKHINWVEYEQEYNEILERRSDYQNFAKDYQVYSHPCILCSEATPEKCHRRLLAEKINSLTPIEVVHL